MHIEHSCAHIKGENSNTQLVIGFSNILIIILFYKKNVKWKSDFFFLKKKNQCGKLVFKTTGIL